MSDQAVRQSFAYDYHGKRSYAFGVPMQIPDPEFAWFCDCLHGSGELFVWCEVMKIRKSNLIPQSDLFSPTEKQVEVIAWYGDASEED